MKENPAGWRGKKEDERILTALSLLFFPAFGRLIWG
jgi:hypothetical protein